MPFGRNIGYNFGDKVVFLPANYHLLRRYRNPVRGHHLSSVTIYAALIFNWVHANTTPTVFNWVPNAYGTVSLHGAIVKITENRVIVNVYLEELFDVLLVMNL